MWRSACAQCLLSMADLEHSLMRLQHSSWLAEPTPSTHPSSTTALPEGRLPHCLHMSCILDTALLTPASIRCPARRQGKHRLHAVYSLL
jgi:hypothetical protein